MLLKAYSGCTCITLHLALYFLHFFVAGCQMATVCVIYNTGLILFFYIHVLFTPDFLVLANSHPPASSPVSHDSYQGASLETREAANHIFSNYCSCHTTARCNTLWGKWCLTPNAYRCPWLASVALIVCHSSHPECKASFAILEDIIRIRVCILRMVGQML